MYACPNCGSNIKFDPASQKMKCSYCDTKISPHDYMHAKGADEEKGVDLEADEYEVTYYTCPQCGGELITEDNTAATFCSYCGSSTILEMRVGKEKKPDYIIPFKKTREECAESYKKALKRAIFAPNDLRNDETIERFRGIYMPYWIYDVKSKGELFTTGKVSSRRGDYVYTKHYSVTSDVETDYSGISYDASSSFEDRLSEAIAPFDLKESDHFTSAYLSGFYADTSDVKAKLYDSDANSLIISDVTNEIYKDSSYRKHGVSAADIEKGLEKRTSKTGHKLGMFPVWFLSNQIGDRVSYAVVNGQTGKVAMDIPVDIRKYFLGTIILALPIFALLLLSHILVGPRMLVILTMIISLIALICANKQANTLFARELMVNDKGYNSKKTPQQIKEAQEKAKGKVSVKNSKVIPKSGASSVGAWSALLIGGFVISSIFGMAFVFVIGVLIFALIAATRKKKTAPGHEVIIAKAPVNDKMSLIIFPIITMVIGVIVLIVNPIQDAFYYATAIIGMVMTGSTVMRLTARHNKLSSRKLPQFNKRGGEEHENDD